MAGNEEDAGVDVDVVFSERDDGQEGDGSMVEGDRKYARPSGLVTFCTEAQTLGFGQYITARLLLCCCSLQ
jgi:hypothetical protein